MGMILRIASSRIVGQGDIVGRSGYFSLNLSAISVMRGRLDARRTLKSLVADLRYICFQYSCMGNLHILLAVFSETDYCPCTCQCAIDAKRYELRKKLGKRATLEVCLSHRRYDIAQRIQACCLLRPVWHRSYG